MTDSVTALIQSAHGFGRTGADARLLDCVSLGALFAQRAAEAPDALFLKYFDDDAGEAAAFSYREFARLVGRAAQCLSDRGLKAGDCFATLSYKIGRASWRERV